MVLSAWAFPAAPLELELLLDEDELEELLDELEELDELELLEELELLDELELLLDELEDVVAGPPQPLRIAAHTDAVMS